MQKILKIARVLNSLSLIASCISGVALWVLCLLTFGLALALNFSYVNSKLDDFSLYCFALMVLLAFSWTLQKDKHVRIDLLYAHYSDKTKVIGFLLVNLFFILPFCLVMIKYGLDFTIQSYKMGESSQNGKIPYYFVFKSFVVLGFVLLSLQSVSEILKSFVKIKQRNYTQSADFVTEETQILKESLKEQKIKAGTLNMELLALIGIAIVLLIIGVPVAFAFGSSGLIVGSYLMIFEENPYVLTFLPNRLEGIFSNTTLIAIPLFILMGMILERSGIAERLINSIAKLFGSFGGGAAMGVILVGVLLSASTGIVGATVVMMGVIAVPTMIKANYNKCLISGVVAASGTLGQIIPPSIILIILADVLNVSVRDLFSAAILPSIMLVATYVLFVLGVVCFAPKLAPASPDDSKNLRTLALDALKMAIPPIVLITLVLGSILGGIVEPTQAAAIGVVGALLLSFLNGQLNLALIKQASQETIVFCGMVFMILIGANCFTLVFNELGGDVVVLDFFAKYLDSPFYFMLVAMLVVFVLGFLIDFFEICYIALPILAGIAMHYQVDMLWFALLVAINLQTSFLTPPFGFSIFFLKSAVGEQIKISEIYKGVVPFILLQVLILLLVFFVSTINIKQ